MPPADAAAAWDGLDLNQLLRLAPSGEGCWRSQLGDGNTNGRVFGGQLLGQALLAAGQTVAAERPVTAMQVMFLRGADPIKAIDYEVTPLLDGKRFSMRHVRAAHPGGRAVVDAQLSFGGPVTGPLLLSPTAASEEDPEQLPSLSECPPATLQAIGQLFNYPPDVKAVLDFRLPQPPAAPGEPAAAPRFRYWVKVSHRLDDRPHLQAAAFAYLSDWCINFVCVNPHTASLGQRGARLYLSSLNHAIWFSPELRADDWLHFDCASPVTAHGRSLAVANVHDRHGRLVAAVTQECLVAESA